MNGDSENEFSLKDAGENLYRLLTGISRPPLASEEDPNFGVELDFRIRHLGESMDGIDRTSGHRAAAILEEDLRDALFVAREFADDATREQIESLVAIIAENVLGGPVEWDETDRRAQLNPIGRPSLNFRLPLPSDENEK